MNRLILLLFSISTLHAFGQSRQGAWESNAAFNYGFKKWKFNSSIGHRTTRLKQIEGHSNQFAFWEVNQFISRSVNARFTGSLGYKYRILNPSDSESGVEQRLTQQLAFVHTNQRIRILSRLRIEQRFFDDEFQHRYRYRLSMDMPLSGYKIDIREFYFIASNEALIEFIDSKSGLDNRISLGLGYVASNLYKVQIDFTQRLERLNEKVDYIPFVHTSLIFNL